MSNDQSTTDLEIGDRQSPIDNPPSSFAVLRRFVRQRAAVERCEMCSAELSPEHEHLVDISTRQLACACQPCAILFSGKANAKFRRVPREIRYLPDFQLTDAQWESLLLPIGMAFFFHSSPAGKVIALYPSPAGATESLLDLESWDEIVRNNPLLEAMEPDTEALLVNRVRGASDHFLAPIDECYRLVGLIRTHWHGLSGGSEMWEVIGKFFAELKERAEPRHAVSQDQPTRGHNAHA
ncbi:MAG TPA: DUF5947 family protein [Pyrinomonadaceae bacterium]|nr:DUF5947 family protein [Pyrinomonadaceae bacterium]